MQRLFPLIYLLVIPLVGHTQISKADYYNTIDNKVYVFSKKQDLTHDSIISFVNTNFQKQEDRIRAYYTWIALNISYDMKRLHDLEVMSLYNSNGMHNNSQDPDTVLKKRTGVCEGISNLMIKFCAASSIYCQKVAGYTKMPDGTVVTDIMHVWNVVQCDSAFHLLDITWSNGYVDQSGKMIKKFSDKYFFTAPEVFIKDHLPLDPMWQLLPDPISKTDFHKDSLIIKSNGKFSYTDSIHAYMQLNEEDQEYTDYLHYYLNDTNSKIFAANLDIFINNAAASELISSSIYYDDYITFHNNTLIKKPTKTNFKKAKDLLLSSRKNHQHVKELLKKQRANTAQYKDTFVKMNEAVIAQDKTIDEQLAYLKKVEKELKK